MICEVSHKFIGSALEQIGQRTHSLAIIRTLPPSMLYFFLFLPQSELSDGELKETQTANYFSNFYPIDCEVPSVNA